MNPPTELRYFTIEIQWTTVQLGVVEMLTVPGEGSFLRASQGRDGDVNDISTGPEIWAEWTSAETVTGLTEGKYEDATIVWSDGAPDVTSEIPFGVLESVTEHPLDRLPADLDIADRAEAHLRAAMHVIEFEEADRH